jgi:acyl-CoA thioesterase-1
MKHHLATITVLLAAAALLGTVRAAEDKARPDQAPAPTGKVYGEWLIRVRPDKGPEYNRLIEQKGLPLFRAAGGRMVGWWNTLIGDLYEHVTIWEYEDMAAFQKAVQFLGQNQQFAQFVAARDPLLSGEENRFLKLAGFADKPTLPEPAKFVIHEIQRVPLRRMDAYLKFMEKDGLGLLKKHGFRPVGPWVVNVGKWTEVTYLFRFQSLAERERLMAQFSAHPDAQPYGGKINEFVTEISTRMLVPAPFAAASQRTAARPASLSSPILPHLEEVAPGVFAAGFADRHASANCGWVALGDHTLLVDLPRGVAVPDFLAKVAETAGKPANRLVLTHFQPGDVFTVEHLFEHGITHILTSAAVRESLLAESRKIDATKIRSLAAKVKIQEAYVRALTAKTAIGDARIPIDFLPRDQIAGKGGAVVHLPGQGVLFAGPLVVNGPRTTLPGSDTARWVAALRQLERLGAAHIVPGFGSWGGSQVLTRQRRFLAELRRQVEYVVAQGRAPTVLQSQVRIPADYLVWMPYDTPTAEDLLHVYRELTVPAAPFNGRPPQPSDRRPHALVLIGDQPHEPGHLEDGLRPVFEATGVVPHFTVDVKALTAENLAKVRLLVILRDGLQRPRAEEKADYVWMTPEQERAVVQFVEGGGAFLNLHNSMGLYPAGGPYLKLVGGRYIGHGPLERFRVEVVDPNHPVTRGVHGFSVADEQHTPPYDSAKVHLLLQNRSDEGKFAAAGWVYEPGRGRLCHLANGHTREALLHPTYQLLMRNAVNWCLRQEGKDTEPRASGQATPQAPKRPDPAFAEVKDDPSLPRVLLIGDSISIGYTVPTRQLLEGKANVHRIPENGGPTRNGLAKLDTWLGAKQWDVIHFNWGLHDLRRDKEDKHQVPLDEYERNLRELVKRLQATGAKLVWASTTPVPAGKVNPPRKNEDVIAHNAAAKRIMEENGIPTDDLYTFAQPRLDKIQLPVDVHFTPQGSRALAQKVADGIQAALGKAATVK